ncbi:hypothetical protein Tsubulata_013294 [Turnera subulata]|uniref:TPX2 C-terminal domain-containing protein n=1 Tax=Turnera subulata TaxID=218843 RepID=A0A9Q0JI33_9ROSI|nr:hypothetical protein Tsubulata_013294 [Turnera subulata]
MAGECEEPFSLSFQADLLHSGSISFGRFEKEDLSWERRSSFSHNRYLDEVEKYSRPGSVTEKKAYFEAHFKKKGMRLPGSFEGHSGREYQTSEQDGLDNEGNREENENWNGSSDYAYYDEGPEDYTSDEKFHYNNEGGDFDYAYDDNHSAHYGENTEASECNGEVEIMESGREDHGIFSSESHMEVALDNSSLLDGAIEAVETEDAHKTESRFDEMHLDEDALESEIKQNSIDDAVAEDESSRTIDPSPENRTAADLDSIANAVQTRNSAKLKAAKESKSVKPKVMSRTNANQVRKSVKSNAFKADANNQYRRQGESSQRMKSEKQPPQAATPLRHSHLRTSKDEDSESCSSRLHHPSESEKEPKIKKVAERRHLGSKKVEPGAHDSANRVRQNTASRKTDTRLNAASFNFKSDERAERRKEFYMKLEEKMHAKEAEMNQIQAITQEKTEAEIKQFRKSLNFKATPMPSFYHSAAPRGSNGNRAVLSKKKPAKLKTTSPASGSALNSLSPSKTGNDRAFAPGASAKTPDPCKSCGTTEFPTTELPNACQTSPNTCDHSHPEGVMDSGVTGKGREKVRDTKLQKLRVSDGSKVHKDQRIESKPKTRNHKSSSEMVRRSMKGNGMGGLPVGVAS